MLEFVRKNRSSPALPSGHRIYAVGDIHGRLDLLEQILEMISDDASARPPAQIEVILLGDLIDRGPASAGVVAKAMAPLGWARLTTLKGNHEAALLAALDGDRDMALTWLKNGGNSALESWGVDSAAFGELPSYAIIDLARRAIPPEVRSWLSRLPTYKHVGDYYFVHAGVRPKTPLSAQRNQDRLWIRDEFLLSRRYHGAVIVHGHSIARLVEEQSNRIGIDTGAYATGRLTAVALEGERRWYLQTDDQAAAPAASTGQSQAHPSNA